MKFLSLIVCLIVLPFNAFAKSADWVMVGQEQDKTVLAELGSIYTDPKRKVTNIYIMIVDEKTEKVVEGVVVVFCKTSNMAFIPVIDNKLSQNKIWMALPEPFKRLGCNRYEEGNN